MNALLVAIVVIGVLLVLGKDDAADAVMDAVWKVAIGVIVFLGFNVALFYGLIIKLIS